MDTITTPATPPHPAIDRDAFAALHAEIAERTANGTLEVPRYGQGFSGPTPAAEYAARALRQAREIRPEAVSPQFGECQTHGPYRLNYRDDEGLERWRPAVCPACQRQTHAERLLNRAAINPRFLACEFDNFEAATSHQRHALAVCRTYAEEFRDRHARGVCLILRGRPGTGKNHLAVAITKAALALGYSALHATAYELIGRLRDTWASRRPAGATVETEAQITEQLTAVDLLVIDEVGRQYGSREEQLHLFQILDGRYRRMRPTLLLSNLSTDDLRARLGEPAWDRLREGGGKILHFDWQSHRGRDPKNHPDAVA